MIRLTVVMCLLCACGQDTTIKPENKPQEFSMCDYYVEKTCVIEHSPHMDINPEILSWGLNTLEYEVNFYYPNLDFEKLAQDTEFRIEYKWAKRFHTKHQGVYDDIDIAAIVNLRRGDSLNSLMRCMDRYFVVLHEVLHFIADRYLEYEYNEADIHDVEFIFKHWASLNELPHDYTVEGRLYTMVRHMCTQRMN